MDLEQFKEALGDEMFAELEGYINDLAGQRDAARQESISGRKGLKAKVTELEAAQQSLMDRLGIDSLDDIENLPDATGMAEAAKQYEAKLKRLERQNSELQEVASQASQKYRSSLQQAQVAKAMQGHEFVAPDFVESYIERSLVWEDDELLFKSDGKLLSVADGVAGLAKARPELLRATPTGGAGVRASNAQSSAGVKQMARAEFEALPAADKVELAKAGVTLN